MSCPHLSYERSDGDQEFEVPRAYCSKAGRFVQSMRADICNDRYDLAHDRDCEIFLDSQQHGVDDGSSSR